MAKEDAHDLYSWDLIFYRRAYHRGRRTLFPLAEYGRDSDMRRHWYCGDFKKRALIMPFYE